MINFLLGVLQITLGIIFAAGIIVTVVNWMENK